MRGAASTWLTHRDKVLLLARISILQKKTPMAILKLLPLILILALVAAAVGTLACTEKTMARNYGGETTIQLPLDSKLLMVTWKEGSNLWYLTRPVRPGEQPETYQFREDSNFGVWQGTVTLVEHNSGQK